jgi:hypothetical protein
MRIANIKRVITPEPGTLLAGYSSAVLSQCVHDDLFISGTIFDDGVEKAVLLSYDLIGLDRDTIERIRTACSGIMSVSPKNVILTCTHTHSGPHTRRTDGVVFNSAYVEWLVEQTVATVETALATSTVEVDIFHYSVPCLENINRRVIRPNNSCDYLPDHKHLMPLADGVSDHELGLLFFVDSKSGKPLTTLVNYAAHPLVCQTGGVSSQMISSDYPGVIRKLIEKELGGTCVFTSGACGDLHPRTYETGFHQVERMGERIAMLICGAFSDAIRNPQLYRLATCEIKVASTAVNLSFRESGCIEGRLPLYIGKNTVEAEVQALCLGDICLLGVPGELLAEPGLEIKWNSPFKKTYILYNSTAYLSYLPHRNAHVSGGYEAETSHLEPLAGFKIVSKAVELLSSIHNLPSA